jgi:hypothetical protein
MIALFCMLRQIGVLIRIYDIAHKRFATRN